MKQLATLLCLSMMLTLPAACGGGDDGDDSGDDGGGNDGGGDDGGGDDGGGDDGGGDDTGPETPVQGTVCFDPSDCQSAQTGLICVVDNAGDPQGICMLVCEDFSQCLNNPEALSRFETDCCQVSGGTRVCGKDENFPEGACE
jgi:hypothetical protein